MDASCGPSNALSSLSKHAQQDHSLQNEFLARNQPQNMQSFKSGAAVDNRLNQEFSNFNGGDFAQNFMNSNPRFQHVQQQQHELQQQQQRLQQQQHMQQQQNRQENGQWVSDFSNISLHGTPQQINKPQGAVSSDWHQQFMNQQNQNHVQQSFQGPSQFAGMGQSVNGPYRTQMQIPSVHTAAGAVLPEHKELHKMEEERQLYEDQFSQLERELQNEAVTQEVDMQMENNEDKEEFAKAARQVQDSLLSAHSNDSVISDKISNSQFLKLMSSISNRSVELEGDKLVDSRSGQDIRDEGLQQHLSDPLRGAKEEMQGSYPSTVHEPRQQPSFPSHQGSSVSQDRVNASHLPDPLAHLKDGDLSGIESPLAAAKVISGNQVKTSDWMEDDAWLDMTVPRNPPRAKRNNIMPEGWQEVYEDYRNDDDFH